MNCVLYDFAALMRKYLHPTNYSSLPWGSAYTCTALIKSSPKSPCESQKKLWWHISPAILGESQTKSWVIQLPRGHTTISTIHCSAPPTFHLNSTHKNAAQLPQSESDWQIKAQYLSPVVVRRAHWGVALSPFGTSLGQLPWLLHLGLQKSPDNPCTRTASSSDSQPVFGFP